MGLNLSFRIRKGRTPVLGRNSLEYLRMFRLAANAGVGEKNRASLSSLIKLPYLGAGILPAGCVLKQVMLQVKQLFSVMTVILQVIRHQKCLGDFPDVSGA